MPSWISSRELTEYLIYSKDEEDTDFEYTIQMRKLLQIADFFNNDLIVSKVIEDEIIPQIDHENCMMFLEDSFQKLSTESPGEEIEKSWFDLFYNTMDYLSKNFLDFLKVEEHVSNLKNLNRKVLVEIFER